ncbi:MAG: ubiquinol-cytochrome C chaperone family protein [Asticcacaulis sp.]
MLDKILNVRFLGALGESVGQSLGLRKPRPAQLTGQSLYAAAVAQSRQVPFYTDYGVADEIGARFELLVLHVVMLINGLKSDDAQAQETSQALFDTLLQALDDTLREQGVGDLTVPKKMKKLGQEVYTRLVRWDDLWNQDADVEAQADYLRRTVYAGQEEAVDLPLWSNALSHYIMETRSGLSVDELLQGRAVWAPLSVPQVKEIE